MFTRLIIFLVYLCPVALMGSQVYANNGLIKIRYGEHLEKDRLVLDFDHKVTSSVFALSNPNRIVIDIPKGEWSVKVSDTVQSGKIKTIHIGDFEHSTSRIVIDMSNTIHIEKSFWLPALHEFKDRLVIDFTQSTEKQERSIEQVLSQTFDRPIETTFILHPPKKPKRFSKPTSHPSSPLKKQVIVIDAGHGGKDSGAVSKNKLYEKTVVLKLAKELAVSLEKTGRYRALLTRSNDKYVALRRRVSFARQHKADLFISIHADSIENRKISGASVYTLSEKASDAQTAKLAAHENKSDLIAGLDLSTQDPDVTNILLDLVARDTTNQSKFFANLIVEELESHHVKTLERPHRYAGFAVLKAPDIPAILIETGFMSNAREARKLNDPNYRKNIVQSLTTGVDAYFVRLASLNLN